MQEYLSSHYCTYGERLSSQNCFIHQENYKLNSVQQWNEYCSKCVYGNKKIGICAIQPQTKAKFHFSNNFSKQKEYLIQCKKQADAEYIISYMNPNAEKICSHHGEVEDFSFLGKFEYLSDLRLSSSRATHLSWNMSKTPRLTSLSIEGKYLFDISAIQNAKALRIFEFTIATSRTDRQNIQSLSTLSSLPLLERVEIQGASIADENIDHLIAIPNLQSVFISPNTYKLEDFAKFEAQKFKIGQEYGVYREDDEYLYCYGKDVRPLTIPKEKTMKIQEYLNKYYALMEKYK